MGRQQIKDALQERKLGDILELIEDAEAGDLEELELVESIGLVHDSQLNKEVLTLLQESGVSIIYVNAEEDN